MGSESSLRGHEVLKDTHDESAHSLRTTITNAEVNINVNALTDSIAIADESGNKVTTTLVGGKQSLDVNVTDITLSHVNDSVKIGDGTDLLAINTDGSTNVVLYGTADNDSLHELATSSTGQLEVAVKSPLNPFGSIHTENLRPIIQSDAVYTLDSGITGNNLITISGSGAAAAQDSCFRISTGTTIYSKGVIQSRKRVKYRAGQGIVARFTAAFTAPVASSYQIIGIGHAEDGLYVGYKNTDFGILYVNRGVRNIRTLTINTRSTTAENVTVTLNGVAFTVAVTNSATTLLTAFEISKGAFTGWRAAARGSSIIFVAEDAGVKAGVFSLVGTTVVGTFVETLAGAAATELLIPQSSWNGDKLDGTGSSGFNLDKTKLNVFQFKIKYLGAGTNSLEVEIPSVRDGSNWVVAHNIKFPNTLTTTSYSNPSFPITMAVYSAGSTTDLVLKCGSYAGFLEGQRYLHGNRFTYYNSLTTVGSTNYQALFTVRCGLVFNGKANQSVVNLLSVAAAVKHTSPVAIYLLRQAALQGTPDFNIYASNSSTWYDSSATTCTIASNSQIVWTGLLGETGNLSDDFFDDITLQPGETITLAAKSITGTPSYVLGTINTREDQ